MPKLRIVHIITTLSSGGAEAMLAKLLFQWHGKSAFDHSVVSLSDDGIYGEKLRRIGIPVTALNMSQNLSDVKKLFRLFRQLRKIRPSLIQTWLYHSDLIGLVLGRFLPAKVVWNIRCSNMDFSQYPVATKWICRLLSKLSAMPDAVIVNSESGRKCHADMGYAPRRWEILPNGFDTKVYRPDPQSKRKMKDALGIDDAPVVGMVARYDPMKDLPTFFAAANIVSQNSPNTRYVLVGRGMTDNNRELKNLVSQTVGSENVFLLGERTDIHVVMQVFDIAALSSLGEGFPNVLGEAMSCGIPCVSTDVGDASAIIRDTGIIVPPQNPKAMAMAWTKLLSLPEEKRIELGNLARKRIIRTYSISTVSKAYETFYLEMLASEFGSG